MKAIFKVFLLTTIIALTLGGTGVLASSSKPDIYINDERLDIYANVTSLGTTLVPMRPIFEKFGMSVEWNNITKTVTAKKDNKVIELTNNSYDALLNGEKVVLNQAPSLEPTSNIFYVNLRFISEALGAKVTWEKTKSNATIHIDFVK
ncbi:copper amine oxidase N-terminal domain-containing protein [Paenibacillus sp. P32E]|uniref:copper amine oxidase N-terminal domain-containing protein n=1 Tax=Paenibacillus sp. P32E TaxID=1349434 RepID=UPI00093967C2|nr:copper amine oxidase N-terminal domain-containing protein [Paenibacillus sp. P32E]OKP83722.1 hypothetical protein A3848_25935 [Paenibacillus sp. P32E]